MFDADPNATLFTEIAALRRDLDELKGRQLVGGANIDMQLTETSDTRDVNTNIASTVALTWWEVVFTPDHATKRPYAEIGFDVEVTPDSGFEFFNSYPSPNYIDSTTVAFIVEYNNPGFNNVNVKLRFSVKADDSGSLTWSIVRQA